MNLLKEIENEQVAKLSAGKEIPDFRPGDTLIVNVKIVEGERTRIQAYEGSASAAPAPASTRTSPCAKSPTAKGSSASFRCTRR